MGAIGDSTPEGNATQEDLALYEAAELKLSQMDTSGSFNSKDPNQRLYTMSFDGTYNDRNNVTIDNSHTNPDLLEKLIPDTGTIESDYLPEKFGGHQH